MACVAAAIAALLLIVTLSVSASAAPSPIAPTWACGKLTDYYAKVTIECPSADCNAAQRNLGGDLLVLDIKSYGNKQCQGCNPSIPSTCCQACKDLDGCNAWVVCTNKEGCGTGCKDYAKGFKVPQSYDDKLPHKFWGNWGSCQGDKWPFGMCSLKTITDTKAPPVTGTNAADGWVSGIITQVALSPKCPPFFSNKTCAACLASKNPPICFDCIKKAKTLDAPFKCTTCASLPTAAGQAACVTCAATSGDDCKRCLDADCSDTTCMNARMESASKAPNLASVDQCFACQSAAKGAACPKCFESYSVPKANRAGCLACVASSAPAAAVGCAGCHGERVEDRKGCSDCLKRAPTAGAASACGSCSDRGSVPATHTAACIDCAVKSASDDARGYCSNLERETSKEAVAAFYRCLLTAKSGDTASSCWQCHRNGVNPAVYNGCYQCVSKVSAPNGIHCSHCWSADRVKAKTADKCEACVLSKDKAKGEASSCWS